MVFKEVKKTMIDQSLTITQLASMTGYTRGHLSNIINGKFDSIRAKKVVSLALNKKFEDLWATENNQNL